VCYLRHAVIAFVYGTTAELIKLAPVYHRIVDRGSRPALWCTGQQLDELPAAHDRLSIPQPDVWLARGSNGQSLTLPTQIPGWALSVAKTARAERRSLEASLWSDGRPPLVIVHGDTMTTVVGALLGRWLGATVAHVEAGLRSNRLLHPFPEEIDRRIAAVLAHVHYAPGARSLHNLRSVRGTKVDTEANTVLDALRLVPPDIATGLGRLPETYGLASLHRFELVQSRDRLVGVMELLATRAEDLPIYMVTDPLVSELLQANGLDSLFNDRLVRVPKLPYFEFVALLRGAAFVITDSGGLQEECAYLDLPCLVHRAATERGEGLGSNAVLSGLDLTVVDDFLRNYRRFRHAGDDSPLSPSDIIASHLEAAGFTGRATVQANARELSVVVPARQAAGTIRTVLNRLVWKLDESGFDWEIIVVSDGSRDGTAAEARRVESDRVHVVHYVDPAGKGFAVRYGFAHASGDLVAFFDADDSIDPQDLLELVHAVADAGADVAIGSKAHPDSVVNYRAFRKMQLRVFSSYVRRMFRLDVADTQTGCKVFRRAVLDEVLPDARMDGFAFDIELLAYANDLGFSIVEGPVHVSHSHPAIVQPRVFVAVVVGSLRLAWVRRSARRVRRAS
jgi:UDP-N-acetylglucosamine 2-epimerase (non-hydrolysing)